MLEPLTVDEWNLIYGRKEMSKLTPKPNDKPQGPPKGMNYPGPGPKAGKPFGKK